MSVIHITEEDTTASSRIFLKILFEDMAQGLGMKKLAGKMKDEVLPPSLSGIFPVDNPRGTRFSIHVTVSDTKRPISIEVFVF